jgi:eukaryotic-like serine/threonine-protein kinase
LQREAFVGRSVSHPHLVPALATCVTEPPRFMVMPWLDGQTLSELLATGPSIDVPAALWFVRQAAEGLDALHQAGWMHGDVSASNIHVSPSGHVTLIDLSFARRTNETGSVADRCVMGTYHYLAPEYLTSALRADIRSDIYSLGIVLYEMLAGRVPFEAESAEALASLHCRAIPPDLARLAPQAVPEVVQLVRRMLAKDPLRRPQSPRDLVSELVALEIATFSQRARS